MQQAAHSALPEGVPPEGLRIIKAESEEELEEQFAELAKNGYVPAQELKINAEYDADEGAWHMLYVLPLWRVGGRDSDESEEMFR